MMLFPNALSVRHNPRAPFLIRNVAGSTWRKRCESKKVRGDYANVAGSTWRIL
jgi:hypothetical protein